MAYTMTGVITGATVPVLTSPTYTLATDSTSAPNSRQSVVTALGGTQAGVAVHSVSNPFTVTVDRTRSLRTLGKPGLNGLITNVGRNTYNVLFRKGMLPLAGQPISIGLGRLSFEIPAGAETNDLPSVRAFFSLIGGWMFANAGGASDTTNNAVL